MKNIPKAKKSFLAAIQTAKSLQISDANLINAYLGLAYCLEKSDVPAAIRNYEKVLTLTTNEKTRGTVEKILRRLKPDSQ